MRRWATGLVVVALAAGCAPAAQSPAPAPTTSIPQPGGLDPARINRVRGQFPPDYEVGPADGVGSPTVFWGLRDQWTAEPAPCTAFIATGDPASARGLSASGAGGTVYVAVIEGAPAPDRQLTGECDHWTMTNAHSSATVTAVEAPRIDGAQTAGLAATIRTVVESGTETDSATRTYTAYLAEQAVFVTLVTDPGALGPPLPPQFAADLLVATVAALRG